MHQEKLEYCSKNSQAGPNTKKRKDGWIVETITQNIQSKRNTVRQYFRFLHLLHGLNIFLIIQHS